MGWLLGMLKSCCCYLQPSAASALYKDTAIPSRQCSLYVLFLSFEKECKMKILFLGFLVLGLITSTSIRASAASAQNPETSDQHLSTDTSVELGYRISERGNFQIVEHGHWSPPYRPIPTQHLAGEAVFSVQRPHKNRKSAKFRSNFQRTSYLGDVHAAEARFGIPHGLLDALIWTESRYNPRAVSSAGAAGLGQLMPGTATDLGVRNRFDPQSNIQGAASYLRQMLDRFGMVHLALAAYNAGPGAVGKAKGIPLNSETPSYVRSVIARWNLQ
jgi:Transglycosylase SLT domain